MSNSISELLQVTHDEKMKILEHYNLTEEQMIENVKIIKDWLDKNAHLPKENGEFVVTFFIAAMNPFVVTIYFHYIGMEIKENCLFSLSLLINGGGVLISIYFFRRIYFV